jgi:predicted  nucleic acid-binding Zn-ribbon protein
MLQVLHGGENLLDKVEQLKQRSAATKNQLEVAARQQEEQRRRLEQLQLERLDLDAQYSSLEVRAWLQAWLCAVVHVTAALCLASL